MLDEIRTTQPFMGSHKPPPFLRLGFARLPAVTIAISINNTDSLVNSSHHSKAHFCSAGEFLRLNRKYQLYLKHRALGQPNCTGGEKRESRLRKGRDSRRPTMPSAYFPALPPAWYNASAGNTIPRCERRCRRKGTERSYCRARYGCDK